MESCRCRKSLLAVTDSTRRLGGSSSNTDPATSASAVIPADKIIDMDFVQLSTLIDRCPDRGLLHFLEDNVIA